MRWGRGLRKTGRVLTFAIVAVLAVWVAYRLLFAVSSIQKIEVVGQNVQVDVNQKTLPQSLLFLSTSKLKKQILEDNPLIGALTVSKKYPHTLVITVLARNAVVVLRSNGRTVGLDDKGYVIDDVRQSGLPVLIFPVSPLVEGVQVSDRRVLTGIGFLDATRTYLDVREITSYESTSLLAKTPQTDIYFSQDADTKTLGSALQILMAGFKIKGKLPSHVDLRFNKPVVTF
ncbi:FtsQ-type POTRA domain-containing protein [Patescibacteria group bacterium]|nr:FtsQ-type POTRA domain-containing protein [Patescibacteria group bacterium]